MDQNQSSYQHLKNLGLDFFENSFLLKENLLKFDETFSQEAEFKPNEETYKKIANELRKFAEKASEPFNDAKKNLEENQKEFKEKKNQMDEAKENEGNKIENAEIKYFEESEKIRKRALEIFERDKINVDEKLKKDEEIADNNLENAERDSNRKMKEEQKLSKDQYEEEKKRMLKELDQKRVELESNTQGQRDKLKGLEDSIKWHEGRPWYEVHVKTALTGLYAARGSALAVLKVAEENAKYAFKSTEELYKVILENSEVKYFAFVEASKNICKSSITAAKETHRMALETAKITHKKSLEEIQNIYDNSHVAADELGKKVYNAYISNVDFLFELAKKKFDEASEALISAKIKMDAARKTYEYASEIISENVENNPRMFIVRKILFKFHKKKENIRINCDLSVLENDLKFDFDISFKDIENLLDIFAEKIWLTLIK